MRKNQNKTSQTSELKNDKSSHTEEEEKPLIVKNDLTKESFLSQYPIYTIQWSRLKFNSRLKTDSEIISWFNRTYKLGLKL